MSRDLAYIRSGSRYRCYDITGADAGEIIEIDSLTRPCQLNARYYVPNDDGTFPLNADGTYAAILMTIGLADFATAVEAGWIKYVPAGHVKSIEAILRQHPIRRMRPSDPDE